MNKNRGFTLIEVIVALAIGGVALMGFTQMIHSMRSANKGTETALDLQLAMNDLIGTFGNTESCKSAMYDLNGALNPLIQDKNPNTPEAPIDLHLANPFGGNPFERNRFVPGSRTLYINRFEAVPVENPNYTLKFIPYTTNSNPPEKRYAWAEEVRWRIDVEIENINAGPRRYKDISDTGPGGGTVIGPKDPPPAGGGGGFGGVIEPPADGGTGTPPLIIPADNAGGISTGQVLFRRSLMVSTMMVHGAGSVPDPGPSSPPPASSSVPPPTSTSTGWVIPKCSYITEGYRIQGIGRCYWCPRANDTDEGNVACALGSNVNGSPTSGSTSTTGSTTSTGGVGTGGSTDTGSVSTGGTTTGVILETTTTGASIDGTPNLYQPFKYTYKGPLKLAVEEAKILNMVFADLDFVRIKSAEAEAGVGAGGTRGTGDPAEPPPSYTPGTAPSLPPGAQWASASQADIVTCSAGWYQAGVRYWTYPIPPSNLPVPMPPPPCYPTGKYATCNTTYTNITQVGGSELKFVVYCCEVATD